MEAKNVNGRQVVLNEFEARALMNIDAKRLARIAELETGLAQIRALCDDAGYAGLPSNLVAQVRGILDAVDAEASR